LNVLSTDDKELNAPIFLFESASEEVFLERLKGGLGINLDWKPVDELAVANPRSTHYFQAEQIKAALKGLSITTNEPLTIKTALKSTLKAVRSEVSNVEVISAPRDRRIAWLVPRLKPGIREEDTLKQARETVLGWGRHEADLAFEQTVRQQANEIGHEKVLFLNYSREMVQVFIRVLGSMRAQDQQDAGFVLGGLLALARNESFNDWPIWTTDFADNAKHLLNLITLVLDKYHDPHTGEGSNDNE
jgi:hypothetical protein